MNNPYKQLSEEFKKLKSEVSQESRLKFPSVYSLRNGAEKTMNLLKNSTIKDPEFVNWVYLKRRSLGIFIEDLTGELEHDFDKRNVGYYDKWTKQKENLVNHLVNYNEKFKERIEKE